MSELLDELARSMAGPMPRSRVLRLLGGALVGIAFPAARATAARATHDCPAQGEILCQCPAANGLFFKLCCWSDKACTCDIPRQATCCRKPKIWDGSKCVAKVCGPDITGALDDVLSRTRAAFAEWSSAQRAAACISVVQSPVGAFGWEINQLGPGGREEGEKNFQPQCATCGGSLSVQVGSDCHYAGSVNYVVYGVMLRLCHDHLESKRSSLARNYNEESMALYITTWKMLRGAPNLRASLAWGRAGYNGWPGASTPRAELPGCEACPKQLTSRLTVRWLPIDRNI